MASLRFLFGMIPATSRYEAETEKAYSDYKEYTRFQKSDELKHFQELEKQVNSPEFKQKVKEIKSQNFKKTEEFRQEQEYKQLLKSSMVKKYLKDKDSEEGKSLAESSEVKKLHELEKVINSEKFAETKKYMSLSASQKYEQSEEFKLEKEYLELVKSEKILWYKKIQKKYPFSWVEKWELSFEDKFEASKPDPKVWMSRYPQGDKTVHKPFVQADDKAAYTDGKNTEIIDKKLRILTKREKGKGLVWSGTHGFFEKEFDFTSDMLCSAPGLKTSYGMIEAKIKFGNSGVTQAFSLNTERMLPHIDVVKFEKNKISSASFWKDGKSVSSTGGGKYTSDYHIFTLIWEAGKLTWKVNGVDFKVLTGNVPDMELFLSLSSNLKEKAGDNGIPSAFEIDWIRVYKAK
ncbi:MAG: family 16 glycosylhydrolase [Bacteroidales bacterium]|nr:family 16 glycosylhydrolase [Bacteroidales bacterium]